MQKIKIVYHDAENPQLEKISKGDWIDLYVAKETVMKQGEYKMISLGVSMKLPYGYEANIVPRSSTFKTFGVLQTNHFGVIDSSYSGTNDIWHFPAYATRDVVIPKGARICQFRINEIQPQIEFEVVTELDEHNRSGFGSTGITDMKLNGKTCNDFSVDSILNMTIKNKNTGEVLLEVNNTDIEQQVLSQLEKVSKLKESINSTKKV